MGEREKKARKQARSQGEEGKVLEKQGEQEEKKIRKEEQEKEEEEARRQELA